MKHSIMFKRKDTKEIFYLSSQISSDKKTVVLVEEKRVGNKIEHKEVPIEVYQHEENEIAAPVEDAAKVK